MSKHKKLAEFTISKPNRQVFLAICHFNKLTFKFQEKSIADGSIRVYMRRKDYSRYRSLEAKLTDQGRHALLKHGGFLTLERCG
jgi:hypothetical protein